MMRIRLTYLTKSEHWRAELLGPDGNSTHAVNTGITRAEAIGLLILNYPVATGSRVVG